MARNPGFRVKQRCRFADRDEPIYSFGGEDRSKHRSNEAFRIPISNLVPTK
jgi:hypothetical protein